MMRIAEYALVGLIAAMNLIAEACDPRNAERMRWTMRVVGGVAVGTGLGWLSARMWV